MGKLKSSATIGVIYHAAPLSLTVREFHDVLAGHVHPMRKQAHAPSRRLLLPSRGGRATTIAAPSVVLAQSAPPKPENVLRQIGRSIA